VRKRRRRLRQARKLQANFLADAKGGRKSRSNKSFINARGARAKFRWQVTGNALLSPPLLFNIWTRRAQIKMSYVSENRCRKRFEAAFLFIRERALARLLRHIKDDCVQIVGVGRFRKGVWSESVCGCLPLPSSPLALGTCFALGAASRALALISCKHFKLKCWWWKRLRRRLRSYATPYKHIKGCPGVFQTDFRNVLTRIWCGRSWLCFGHYHNRVFSLFDQSLNIHSTFILQLFWFKHQSSMLLNNINCVHIF
jgi:hypothetical protein